MYDIRNCPALPYGTCGMCMLLCDGYTMKNEYIWVGAPADVIQLSCRMSPIKYHTSGGVLHCVIRCPGSVEVRS